MNTFLRLIVGGLLIVATVAITVQILIRFVITNLGISFTAPWTEELARYCFLWSAFLGAGTLCRSNGLISVDVFVHLTPRRIGRFLQVTSILAALLLYVLMLVVGWQWAQMAAIQISPVLRIPMIWIYAAMPVGAIVGSINLITLLTELFSTRDAFDRYTKVEVME